MKYFFIYFLFIFEQGNSQDVNIIKATQQTFNAGAFPRSITNYTIFIKKKKAGNWRIDSIVSNATKKAITFKIEKQDNTMIGSPANVEIKPGDKLLNTSYTISFYSARNGSGWKHNSETTYEEIPFFTTGVLYYRIGAKKKKILISSFEKLETVNAP